MNPVPDRAAAAALGAALRALDYEGDVVTDLIGDEVAGEREEIVVAERRLSESPVETAIRLLYLQLPVPESRIDSGMAEALLTLGLASRVAGELVPHARIIPVDDTLLASDGFTRDADDPPDYVATYTPTARTCDLLTPRPRCRRALDVGTGSGIHALLAAAHAKHVVATDVNPRALAYTELNAALNGHDNIECRQGSFFEPAGDETFDLITCNAPFVISPEQRWAYRDSAFNGDDLTAHVVREASARLADGGYATLLGSWLIVDEDGPEDRPAAWVKKTGCDAWILTSIESDALEHASSWNSSFFADADHVRVRARAVDAVPPRPRRERRGGRRDPPPPPQGKDDASRRRDRRGLARGCGRADPPRIREPRDEGSPRRAARARDAVCASSASSGRTRPRSSSTAERAPSCRRPPKRLRSSSGSTGRRRFADSARTSARSSSAASSPSSAR